MSLFLSLLIFGIIVMTAIVAVIGQRRAPLEDDDNDPNPHPAI
jgi:hypothetical protein